MKQATKQQQDTQTSAAAARSKPNQLKTTAKPTENNSQASATEAKNKRMKQATKQQQHAKTSAAAAEASQTNAKQQPSKRKRAARQAQHKQIASA